MRKRKFSPGKPFAASLAFAACIGFSGCRGDDAEAGSVPGAAEKSALCGAYGEWISPVPADALEVFARAAAGTEYAARVPVKVSTQLVAGRNHRFAFADGKEIVVFEPLPGRGAPELSEVVDRKSSRR